MPRRLPALLLERSAAWCGIHGASGGGTLTGPDANGYYTATLTGFTVPTNAVDADGRPRLLVQRDERRTADADQPGGLSDGDSDEWPTYAATSPGRRRTGGLVVIAPNINKVANGFTGRRAIVEDKRCNACHQELGTFTADAFHAGQRNDGTTCSWCHTPNRGSGGWSADRSSSHAIHGAAKRTVPYTWHSAPATR